MEAIEKQVKTNFSSGHLPIPDDLQTKLGLKEGSEVILQIENGNLVAHLASPKVYDIEKGLKAIAMLRGIFAGPPSLSDELVKMREEDEEHERQKWSR